MRFYQAIVLARPKVTVAFLILLSLVAAFFAQNYKVDASADALVLEGDEDLAFFREIGKRYAAEDFFVIAYQPKQGLLSQQSLSALAALVDDLGSVNGVSSVMSVLDVPLLYSPKLTMSDLGSPLKTLRNDTVDKVLAEKELLDSPIYSRLLTSKDMDTTAIQVNLTRDVTYVELMDRRDSLRQQQQLMPLSVDQQAKLLDAEAEFKAYATAAAVRQQRQVTEVRAILDLHRPQAKAIYLGGLPMIANDMVSFVKSDLQTFGIGIIAFIVLLLTVIFRSFRWVILPLLSCILTNIFMLGLLGFLDWRMTVISSNFIALLLIITLAIGVHLVVRYRELQMLDEKADQQQLTIATVSQMLRPCLYTALTTIVAFMSLVISGIRPVMDFGWMMTVGVVVALMTTFIVVPLGMSLGPAPVVDEKSRADETSILTLSFARFAEHHGQVILWFSATLFAVALFGLSQLKVENRFIDYFDESTEIYQGMELIDSDLGGTIPLELILFAPTVSADESVNNSEDEFDDFDDFDESDSSPNQNYWFTSAGLNKIEAIHNHLDQLTETGKVLSLATVYRVARDLLGGNLNDIELALAYRSLPAAIKDVVVSPYLHEASNEARITIRVKETSRSLNRAELLTGIDHFMSQSGYSRDDYRLTGMLVLYNNMLQSLFTSQILTLGLVFIAITAMLIVLFQSLSLALIGITPNLMAALFVLGGMGIAGIPLDMMTITIAAISIGIGVDNTIHYIHRYKREFAIDQDYIASMHRSHASIGRAMYYTSITIIFGFSILALSNFKPSIYFGLLTGLAMLSALLGSLLLLPRLLLLFQPIGKTSLRL